MTVASMLLLPDETYEEGARNAQEMLAVLTLYDDFLARHRIRPEFFCKYREKLALQRSLRTLHSLQGTMNRKRRRHAEATSEHRFTGKYETLLLPQCYSGIQTVFRGTLRRVREHVSLLTQLVNIILVISNYISPPPPPFLCMIGAW